MAYGVETGSPHTLIRPILRSLYPGAGPADAAAERGAVGNGGAGGGGVRAARVVRGVAVGAVGPPDAAGGSQPTSHLTTGQIIWSGHHLTTGQRAPPTPP